MAAIQRFRPKILLKVSSYQQYAHFLRSIGRQAGKSTPKPNRGLSPVNKLNGDDKIGGKSVLLRPFGFTILVGGVSFGGCAIWQYETLRKLVGQMKGEIRSHNDRFIGKAGTFRDQINSSWNSLSPGRKVVAGIIGINTLVFLAWRIPALRNVMSTYFVSSPFGKAPCWSMLFSSWSHYSSLHIFVNMYVFWSFGSFMAQEHFMGREQFVAFYTTAGVFSAFTAFLWKFATNRTTASLGASGALLAVLGAMASQYPDGKLSIAFVDHIFPHSFTVKSGITAMICFDTLGLILRWRFLDHAAHLGGMFFGIWYGYYGHKWIWAKREGFVKVWHGIRGKP